MGLVKMHATLFLLFTTAYVLADTNKERGTKLPFVADAVGNALPPPSNVPASVGSPVNLLTPDRYEFYTFDESGELVKRLMTLEEIQAIVAAGEEGDSMVTFANDDQPTVAFNFSQPPSTKVHNVVTNVQNVLKAQMEAHKNKPLVQPILDTPDVSDTWSLILPSIFGNTGVDIVPDKSSGSFTTPETETIEIDNKNDIEDLLSKEGNQLISNKTISQENNNNNIDESSHEYTTTLEITSSASMSVTPTTFSPSSSTTEISKEPSASTTVTTITVSTTNEPRITTTFKPSSTTTTLKPSTTTTTFKPSTTTTLKPSSTTTLKPSSTTTLKPSSTTTLKPSSTTILKPSSTTTLKPSSTTTLKPSSITTGTEKTTTTTSAKPTTIKVSSSTTIKATTSKPEISTQQHTFATELLNNKVENDNSYLVTSTEKNIIFEKIGTFFPLSTVKYVTERTTHKPSTTKADTVFKTPPVTTSKIDTVPTTLTMINTLPYVSSTIKVSELEKVNTTTITTQFVSPSTIVSSTKLEVTENPNLINNVNENIPPSGNDLNLEITDNEPLLPLFDVAQSISQIASDLGGDFRPLPTVSNIIDTTKVFDENFESKENTNMDFLTADEIDTKPKPENESSNEDNFVKISTLDPHPENKEEKLHVKEIIKKNKIKTTSEQPATEQHTETETTTMITESNMIDPILNESMDDLILQVVNEVPHLIVHSESNSDITTTEQFSEMSTEDKLNVETTTETYLENTKNEYITTEKNNDEDSAVYTTTVGNEITTEHIVLINDIKESDLSNNNDVDEYIQISISDSKSGLETTTDIFDQKESVTYTPKNDQDDSNKEIKITYENKLHNINNNEIPNLELTTIKIELTTNKSAPDSMNNFSLLGLRKVNIPNIVNNNKKKININIQDKISDFPPKIDEFKKKIQKVNIAEEELANNRNNSWKLIPTVTQSKDRDIQKDKVKPENHYNSDNVENKDVVLEFFKENQGLEVTTKDLSEDIAQFTKLCNELAFRYWNVMTETVDKKRSFVLSPYSITSMLAMMFMGARGATSGEMNEILKLDDMVTFNPHFTLKNISDSIEMNQDSGIVVSAFIRELYSDRNKGKILTFYKERAQHFYNGHVEEINFKLISDIIRRRTNLLVKRYTWGKIAEYMKTNTIVMQPPLAAFSANIFQTDCTGSSVGGRDGEMYFVVSPNVRQRRLVPVPAVVYKKGFLAGYDPVLDVTAAALGNTNSIVSTLFVMPGQQGNVVHAEDLEKLEKRLLETNPTTQAWNRLLRTLLPRIGLELQIPRFSHKSIFNVSSSLRKMGLKDLFDAENADLGGLNGPSKDLFLSDMVQMTSFVTCGEDVIGDQHHIEEYPESLPEQRRRTSRWASYFEEPRDYQRAFHDPHDVSDAMNLPLHLRPRQARVPARNVQSARLKFDRPFLFFTRHNPTGMILYVGRYNPRLLP